MGYCRGLTWHPGLVSAIPDRHGQMGEFSGGLSICLGPEALALQGDSGGTGLVQPWGEAAWGGRNLTTAPQDP